MAQPSSTGSYKIDKLKGDNYTVWARRMELLFRRSSDALWKVVNGDTPRPPANDPMEANWITRDLAGQTELLMHLHDTQAQLVRELNSSAAIWKFLEDTYKPTDRITQVTAMKKLIQHTLADNTDVKVFLQSWRVLLDNVLLSGFALDANQQGTFLLMALPSSWRSFISTQSATAALSMTDLYARTLQEDSLHTSSASTSSGLTLTTATNNFTN
ncbi:hypothetical protein L7F22_020153 [Adiantum nelumboides]|nr:hypothetical protein [Adiantum nelumboides]